MGTSEEDKELTRRRAESSSGLVANSPSSPALRADGNEAQLHERKIRRGQKRARRTSRFRLFTLVYVVLSLSSTPLPSRLFTSSPRAQRHRGGPVASSIWRQSSSRRKMREGRQEEMKRTLPSKSSSEAPPPVETCESLSSASYLAQTVAVSPARVDEKNQFRRRE